MIYLNKTGIIIVSIIYKCHSMKKLFVPDDLPYVPDELIKRKETIRRLEFLNPFMIK